ncbi:DEAD/DEAH box helicase [Kordiimonas lacus]|uniref:ATP-dependent RNA helicase RhlE n=1 Tax=Kordiimonas lacus TaxID=637679 RepID=A0A1G7CCD3_9PROT|nr:DEAD/DEAH box helicase [Kordiimonas lacus]SDE36969.1 ATP-dependent RNA helicase RhlE [Kordiimonas lacus]
MTYFKDLGLAESVLRAVDAAGYTTPTPIQRDVIPAMNAHSDVIGIAQTGTGKTASFVLPILNRIAARKKRHWPGTCGALILTPTRELAQQIAEQIQTFSKFMKVSAPVVVGGVSPRPQIAACAPGVDIIVATPGRLLDHMASGAIRLDQTLQVVADEADQMMDMGFLPELRKIMLALPKGRQTILMSATMPPQIRKLANEFMTNPTEISVAPASTPIARISQIVMRVEKNAKSRALVDVLADDTVTKAIVFTRTKHGADKVAAHLAGAGQPAEAIHGDKGQGEREKALAGFRDGETRILVATEIAARGIDIDDISHVINFDMPHVPEAYVHRIGRTARAGRSGVAISLCDASEVKLLREIEKLTGQQLLPASDQVKAEQAKVGADSSDETRTASQARPQATKATSEQNQKSSRGIEIKSKPQSRKPSAPPWRKPGPEMPTDGLMRMLGKSKSLAAGIA